MHLVKSSVRFKFFDFSDFAEFLRFCLIFERIIKILLFCWILQHENFKNLLLGNASLLYEVPGGNQVDGLPPVASTTGEGKTGSAPKNN